MLDIVIRQIKLNSEGVKSFRSPQRQKWPQLKRKPDVPSFVTKVSSTKVITSYSFPRVCIVISSSQHHHHLFKLKAMGLQYFKTKCRPGIACSQKRDPNFLEQCYLMEWKRKQVRTIALKFTLNFQLLHPSNPPLPWRPSRTPKVNLKEQEDHPVGDHNVEARIPLATYWNTNSSFKFAPWYDPDRSPFESRQSWLIRVKMVERVVLCRLGGWCQAEEGVNGRWTIWSADRRIWCYLCIHFHNQAHKHWLIVECVIETMEAEHACCLPVVKGWSIQVFKVF